jgi:hypothetical protein
VKRILEVLVEDVDHAIAKSPEKEKCTDQREGDRVALFVDPEHLKK